MILLASKSGKCEASHFRIFGARRIKDELRKMGIRVSEPTIQKVLRENGFHPRKGHFFNFDHFKSAAKDAVWGIDYFFVRTAKGVWLNVLLVIDLHTREMIDLTAYDGWEASSEWTISTFADAMAREDRKPEIVVHDHGTPFLGQFERQLRVLDIERRRTPTAVPNAIGTDIFLESAMSKDTDAVVYGERAFGGGQRLRKQDWSRCCFTKPSSESALSFSVSPQIGSGMSFLGIGGQSRSWVGIVKLALC